MNPGYRNPARRDLALIVAASLVFAVLSVQFELSERLAAWTGAHERLQLDEIPGVLLFVAGSLAWFAWRRVVETRAELARRCETEARLREAMARNRELLQARVLIQENERRALARELHDELGQCLNAVKLDAVCLRDGGAGNAADVRQTAASIIATTDRLQQVVGDMTRRLRPSGLDELGLAAALEDCIDGWRRRLPHVAFALDVPDNAEHLDETTNITVYRLVQEGLTNVARHARARRVEIAMRRQPAGEGDEIVLSVQDDGVGMRAATTRTGLGLVGMRERVEALAGRLDLGPSALGGFGFVAHLPVPMVPTQ